MNRFARSDDGLVVGDTALGTAVFDLASGQLHLLNPTAAWIIEHRGVGGDLPARFAADHGVDADVAASIVHAGWDSLALAGLVGRPTLTRDLPDRRGSDLPGDGLHVAPPRRVLHQLVALRSDDPDLLERLDESLGLPTLPAPVTPDAETIFFDLVRGDGPTIAVHADDLWEFPDEESLRVQLPGIYHDHAAHTNRSLVLHAGAVVTPDGRGVVVAGHSGSGKSTLVAALVQRGCGLLSEEMVGIHPETLRIDGFSSPLKLDDQSRWLLGLHETNHPLTSVEELTGGYLPVSGEVTVSEVVVTDFRAGAPFAPERRRGADAVQAVVEHAVNLHYSPEHGLAALFDLAESASVWAVTHGDCRDVADRIVDGPLTDGR